ncbi:BTAD domain-containing putative transcriptional regulator [Actinomycetes bacterium KLBMP 9797]
MRFQLLGNPEVHVAGRALAMGSPKQAAVFAALLVDANQPLSADTLVERVWDDSPHDHAHRTLHTYLSRIRRLLAQAHAAEPGGAPVRLHRHRGGGYVLEVTAEQVDMHRFRRLVTRAAGLPGEDPDRAALLREAAALWYGPPLAGIAGEWATRVRTALRGERVDAVVAWADVELRCGNPAAVIGPVTELAAAHPLVEPLAAVLLRVLHAVGRTGEALSRFLEVRRRLVDELGVEPGPALREAQQAILRGRPGAESEPGPRPAEGGEPAMVVPAQLPLDVPDFTGRRAELRQLDAMMESGSEQPTATAVIMVSGTAGVGKSALVVHWGHRVRGAFPDGQLYVDLRGFDPGGAVLGAAEALRGFLTGMRVPAEQIPAGLEERAALYRSILADRRVLIVLDNAGSERDVRPLLPGAPHCLVVVASRNRLPGLVAGEAARPVELGLLPASEARALLAGRVGARRLTAEPAAVDEILAACARLPLALTVAAARAMIRPDAPLARLAEELRDARSNLDAFAEEDEATDVRAVLSWSYRALPPPAARLFRLIGLHPGPDLTPPVAAALIGEPVGAAVRQLRALVRASLLIEHVAGRYTLHDLLRVYAAEVVRTTESAAGLEAARRRMLNHYLHSAYAADRLLHPHREPIRLQPAGADVTVASPADHAEALAWFAAEHHVLVHAVRQSYGAGLDGDAWQLAWTLTTYFDLQGHWHDWVDTQRIALAAAARAGDRQAQAFAHRNLGLAYAQLSAFDDSNRHLGQALAGYRELDDAAGQAHTHNTLARVHGSQGRPRAALHETEQAIDLFRRAGHHAGQARALNNVGWYHTQLGENDLALSRCQDALMLHQRIGDRYGEANTWDSLGLVHHHLGRHGRAVHDYRAALERWREVGDRYNEAGTLGRLGDTYRVLGEPQRAREVWQRALTILVELGHADAAQIRRKLDEHNRVDTGPGA